LRRLQRTNRSREYELETVGVDKLSRFYHVACGHYVAEARDRLLAQRLNSDEQGGFGEQLLS